MPVLLVSYSSGLHGQVSWLTHSQLFEPLEKRLFRSKLRKKREKGRHYEKEEQLFVLIDALEKDKMCSKFRVQTKRLRLSGTNKGESKEGSKVDKGKAIINVLSSTRGGEA